MGAAADKEKEYEEWLGRLDIPIEAQADIDTFRKHLAEELGITTDAQVEALWGALDVTSTFAAHGVKQVRVDYSWGVEVRYGIQGMSGLWGWDALQEVRAGEGW